VFGFGRRICPGRALAENSLFAAIAGILATFNISRVPGDDLIPKFGQTLVSYPEPFMCEIQPRSENRVLLVQNRVAHCQ
jgi:cytochrome P450